MATWRKLPVPPAGSTCFDPFPFPDPDERLKAEVADLAERLDAHRKSVQAAHPDTTLTGMSNVLEKLRAGTPLDLADEDVKTRSLALVLRDYHDELDAAVARTYGGSGGEDGIRTHETL
jgi:hypothetical protein